MSVGEIKRVADAVLIGAFCVIIAVPLLGLPTNDPEMDIERTEHRRPAAFPLVEVNPETRWPDKRSLNDFPRRFEEWFNDHLAGRQYLILLHGLAEQYGVAGSMVVTPEEGLSPKTQVIVGREGWLYYAADHSIADYRCTRPFTEQQLEQWRTALDARRDWLERRGIKFLVVIVPNKHTIYPEYLPRWMTRVGDKSRFDQLREHLQQTNSVEIVDLRSALTEAKANYETYSNTDSHWNEYGAYVGYREIISRLRRWFPAAEPATYTEFATEYVDARDDLSTMLNHPKPYREKRVTVVLREPRKAPATSLASTVSDDRRRTSLNPQAPLTTAVIMHDSFMRTLAPYLNEHWQRITYVAGHDFPAELIEAEKPAVVIHEIVERQLMDLELNEPK
ncbi:MAG: hypothetical protein WD648_02145 [Planctomycetaceae bacterium]